MQSDSENQSDYSDLDCSFMSDDEKDDLHFPALHDAVAKNDVQQLTKLLSLEGTEVDSLDDKRKKGFKRTPLHVAAIHNVGSSHYKVAEILLKKGADPNAKDNYPNVGCTPLWYLVKKCDLKTLNLFLKFKADFTWKNEDGESILHPATKNCQNLDVVKFLVENLGLDINNLSEYTLSTPLYEATLYNKNDSHYKMLEYLLDNGADVNAQDFIFTPLYNVAEKANWKVVDLFFKHNADVRAVSNDGKNLLFSFHHKNSNIQTLEKLICDFGLDVNKADAYKRTLFHCIVDQAGEMRNIKVIKCLLKYGGNINVPDKDGFTPLIDIVRYFGTDLVEEDFIKRFDYCSFIIDHTDFNFVHDGEHILFVKHNFYGSEVDNHHNPEYLWKWILEHIAKLNFLSIPIHPIHLEFIKHHNDYKDYFTKCTEELEAMKITKPQNSWINFFNILVDSRRKLKNYAGNEDLIDDYENSDWQKIFPIYGTSIKKNVEKGLKRRKLFDKSCVLLSDCLPIFNSTHLIVKDILDCVLSKKKLSQFCKRRFLS